MEGRVSKLASLLFSWLTVRIASQHSELGYAVRSLSQTYCTWKFCR